MKACLIISLSEPESIWIDASGADAATCLAGMEATRLSFGMALANLSWMWKNVSAAVSVLKFARYQIVSKSTIYET